MTFKFLREIPVREEVRQRLTKLWDYERYGVPFNEGGRYFLTSCLGISGSAGVENCSRERVVSLMR